MQYDEKVNILVVDDLPEKLLVIETILEGLGQNVVMARSGREALRYLLDREVAVILLDVNMPEMDGLETAAMIRSRRQSAHTPIIFITAFNDDMHTAQGYSLGAVDYIFSPVVPEILRTKVGVFVDLFKKTQQVRRQAEEHVALAREQAARAAAEEATRRSTFLAEASSVLTKSLDYDATLRGLARVLVPFLSDFGAVTVAIDRAEDWKTLVAWDNPATGGCIRASLTRSDLDPVLGQLIDRVLRTGHTITMPDRSNHLVSDDGTPVGEYAIQDILFPARSLMILPLEARGRVLGALTLATGTSDRQFGAGDLSLAADLAARAAIAIDNARLYRDIQEDGRRKNEFLAMLAHELRNPLAPIRNSVKILQQSDIDDSELGWASDVIARQVGQMVRLVDDLLDISRITGGKIQLRMEPVDVGQIVSLALETSQPLIESRNHALTVELPSEPVWVEADKARFSQVLSNILNNAAKYTSEGGKIHLSVGQEGEEAVFRVRDTGIGIPSEMLSEVFDLFTQVDRSLDRSQGGLGIGLTLVRRLVELHGGVVQALSEGPGHGSEFILRIPAIARAEPEVSEPVGGDLRERPLPCRILIVDDNADSARSLARLLQLSGHQTSIAHDGPSALQQFEKIEPEFVLLDIGLPGMDGYEVARSIRERPDSGRIVLIALTGYGRDEDRRKSREAGFDHHLVKPVEFDTVLSLLESHREPAGRSVA
jgi:signal transduction histidine kinase/DNA-binding response OmpR family regulator